MGQASPDNVRASIEAAIAKLDRKIAEDPDDDRIAADGTTLAPPEHTWVCGACGKTSRTCFGYDGQGGNVASPGWDESCMLNAVLCYSQKTPDGKWRAVPVPLKEDRRG